MKTISSALCVCVLLLVMGSVQAESHPDRVLEPPKFFVGCPVIWSDGSRGKIVMRGEYVGEQWYYLVQLGGEDGLCWRLPENGLRFNQQAP